jgi:hypothetical protein
MSDDGITVRVGGREIDPIRGGLLALLLGLAVTGYGVYDYQQQQGALEDAVAVDATVVETGVEARSGSSNPGAEYRPTVTFEYRYDGENYTSHSVFPAETTPNYDTRSAAASVLDGYEAGGTATAYVDPRVPREGFLIDRQSRGPVIAIAIGGVVALLGVGSLFRGFRS